MAKVRQDAWTHEDDLLLAETVLRHIREGSTQLNAFEEVGDALNRTSAACGFRWNAEVRNKYVHAIELAKRQRKEKKRAEAKKSKQKIANSTQIYQNNSNEHQLILESDLDLNKVIQFLQSLQYDVASQHEKHSQLQQLEEENKTLKETNESLEKELANVKNRLETVEEDYTTFIQIMERARKLTLLDEQGTLKSPTFRMDKNGNLEQLSQN